MPDSGHFSLWPEPQFAIAASGRPSLTATGGPVTVTPPRIRRRCLATSFSRSPPRRQTASRISVWSASRRRTEAQPYYGTYTAYSGREVSCEMMTTDAISRAFDLTPMQRRRRETQGARPLPAHASTAGTPRSAASTTESLFFHAKATTASTGTTASAWSWRRNISWELVQLGNCGSPIELDEGWLLLTHGVGAMRQYAIGAALLDKKDPSKVLARSLRQAIPGADSTRPAKATSPTSSTPVADH